MGLAASQARLLSLTARISDVEFESQQIQYAKLRLATMEDSVMKEYNEALDAETLTFKNTEGTAVKATFDNICGRGSINNKMNSSSQFVFKKDGQILVPNEVYELYKNFGANNSSADPYEFALFAIGASEGSGDQSVVDAMSKPQTSAQKELYNQISDLVKEFFLNSENGKDENADNLSASAQDTIYGDHDTEHTNHAESLIYLFLNGNEATIKSQCGIKSFTSQQQEAFDNITNKCKQYKNSLFNGNGVKDIYSKLTGNELDTEQQKEFNYFLKWGKILQEEECYLTSDNDNNLYVRGAWNASTDFPDGNIEGDPELLNQMVLYGFITIDEFKFDNKGNANGDLVSTSTNTTMSFTNTSQVDSTALKKAEAKYNQEMKKIERMDKQYDLSLNRLETERTALTTEYDSVKKVITDNIDRTFKIFS